MDVRELEDLVMSVMKNELQAVVNLGAVIGGYGIVLMEKSEAADISLLGNHAVGSSSADAKKVGGCFPYPDP